MEQWKKWMWPAIVVLAVVAWTGAFLISFAVADSNSPSSDDGGSFIVIDKADDWVACQARLTLGIAQGRALTVDERFRVRNECRIGSDAWVLCTDDELSKLSAPELSAFGMSDLVQLVELCRERVGPSEE